jgi:hypothetical protein
VSDQEEIWGYRLVFKMVNLVFETLFNIINKIVILILARISVLIILDSRVKDIKRAHVNQEGLK